MEWKTKDNEELNDGAGLPYNPPRYSAWTVTLEEAEAAVARKNAALEAAADALDDVVADMAEDGIVSVFAPAAHFVLIEEADAAVATATRDALEWARKNERMYGPSVIADECDRLDDNHKEGK